MRITPLLSLATVGAAAIALAACGQSIRRTAGLNGCTPASIHTGPPPGWTASAWSESSPGLRVPYALATGPSAAAVMFAGSLRAGHPTDPANKVLWVMRYPRTGDPLHITARWSHDPSVAVRISRAADSSPGEIYPTYVDLPHPGCWKLALSWGAHRASIDLDVRASAARSPGTRSAPARTQTATPGPLHGVPLAGSTGLRLLVSADPPFVLNVDTGAIRQVSGLNANGSPVLSVLAVGPDAVVWLDRRTASGGILPRAEIYVVRHGSTKARRLGTGWEVVPADGGRAVWVEGVTTAHHCALSEVGLDGRTRRRARSIGCSTHLLATGAGAALVHGHTVVEPATGRTLLHTDGLWAIADGRALTSAGLGPPLTLSDLRTGARARLPWPSVIAGSDQSGTDQAVVQPHGRQIALDFADPAYKMSGTQVFDVWLLDPVTRRFRHLPDMPAAVHLKSTSMAWTRDGRLVILAQTGGPRGDRNLIAVWKPGQRQIAVRALRLPARTNGSDTFAVW